MRKMPTVAIIENSSYINDQVIDKPEGNSLPHLSKWFPELHYSQIYFSQKPNQRQFRKG